MVIDATIAVMIDLTCHRRETTMNSKPIIHVLLMLAVALPASAAIVIDCWDGGSTCDSVSRGFYILAYPDDSIGQVDLLMNALSAGEYTIRMTVREETYDGTEIGVAEITADLPVWTDDPVEVNFLFSDATINTGTRLTFAMEIVSGQFVYYAYETSNGLCPIVQTEGTTPPLDMYRRDGIRVRIYDEEGMPIEGVSWSAAKGLFR